jgi:hypothetical protein
MKFRNLINFIIIIGPTTPLLIFCSFPSLILLLILLFLILVFILLFIPLPTSIRISYLPSIYHYSSHFDSYHHSNTLSILNTMSYLSLHLYHLIISQIILLFHLHPIYYTYLSFPKIYAHIPFYMSHNQIKEYARMKVIHITIRLISILTHVLNFCLQIHESFN